MLLAVTLKGNPHDGGWDAFVTYRQEGETKEACFWVAAEMYEQARQSVSWMEIQAFLAKRQGSAEQRRTSAVGLSEGASSFLRPFEIPEENRGGSGAASAGGISDSRRGFPMSAAISSPLLLSESTSQAHKMGQAKRAAPSEQRSEGA